MDETRESCLAAILARGVIRVLQRVERTGTQKSQWGEALQSSAPDASDGDHQCSQQSTPAEDH